MTALHPDAAAPFVLDSHIDIPWPDRGDAWRDTPARQVDLPKLAQGSVSAACLAAYIPQGLRDADGHRAAWARVQAMLSTIRDIAARPADAPQIAVSVCDSTNVIAAARARGAIAIIPAVENGYAIGEAPERVAVLRTYGVRYMTLTHNGHNALADAAIARADLGDAATLHRGLSVLGRETILQMNRQGVLVDVSHASRDTMVQAVETSAVPIVASHSCARALCDHPRNLDDGQLDLLRESGGLIQITAMPSFLRKGGGGTLMDFVRHVAYVADRIGINHVGISSDFDGGGGIDGWRNAQETPRVVEALRAHGFDDTELAAICGGNFLDRLKRAEEHAGQA
jgi:membrane dipeptidase